MAIDPPVAVERREPESLEICINFGIFVGREVSRTEIDALGDTLRSEIGAFTIFAGRRYEWGERIEAALYEVRVAVPYFALPAETGERDALVRRLVAAAGMWARRCSEDTAPATTLSERIAQEAVSDHERPPSDRQEPSR